MDQVIVFDKSLQQRLQEYEDVLSGFETLPAFELQREWAFYLELTMDMTGWQAIWKIQRKTCEALGIPFPTIVLVFVQAVDVTELTATVRVLAVQDEIHLPERHRVPLTHLYPTKEQDRSVALNLTATANSLDMLRFFYNNLLMPWDLVEDHDWKSRHLESRLRLYYDAKTGVIPRPAAEHLQALCTEAKRLQVKREALEAEFEEADLDPDHDSDALQALTEIHVRMMEIKSEVDILENPLLRGAIIKKHQHQMCLPDENGTENRVWVVYSQGTARQCIQFMAQIENLYPEEVLRFSHSLVTSLECGNPNDAFVLSEGAHEIKTTGALEHGGVLRGITNKEETVLISDSEDVMLDFRGNVVELRHLTIKAVKPQCAIIVRGGQLTLRNCKLVGDGKSSTHQGIIVLAGGKLDLVDCDIGHFCTAIVGNSGSVIVMDSTEIHDCNFGVKVYDNCAMRASEATIRNCKEYGVCVETENDSLNGDVAKVGGFHTLNIIPKLQIECIKGNNNLKGDAIINQKSALRPVEDLFENLDTDPTLGSDEEMDAQNVTVIENGRISPTTV